MSRRSRNTLGCKHVVIFDDVPPKKNDLVWCALCHDYRSVDMVDVVGARIPSWRWICREEHGCRKLEKSFVGQKLKCEMSAIRHAKKNHHTVDMYRPDGDLHHSYTGHDPNQLSLPVMSDDVSDEIGF